MSEPELARDAEWRHLDLRMLLVHPVNELVRFLPLVIGVFVLGRSSEGDPWHYLGVAIPVALGLWRFASTRFRITGSQIELRRGLLSRRVLTAPLDRVRTVELTASPIHRLLGLAKVEIGTGSGVRNGDNRLVLDSLGVAEGRRLRAELLGRTPLVPAGAAEPTSPAEETVILRLDPSWVRFAPLTTSGLVIALAALGGSSQFLGNLIDRAATSSSVDERVGSLPLLISVPLGILVFLAVISTLAIAGYVLANWGFTLSRDGSGRSFHVRRGLLTTRETSIDVERLRGLEIHEPLGLRLLGGGRLTAVVTGLGRRPDGSTSLVPPAPRQVVVGVGENVLGESGPLAVALTPHGPSARRRRHLRALVPTSLVPVTLGTLWLAAGWPLWLAVLGLLAPAAGLWLARDRYAGLGHALTERYLVVRSGSFQGRRDALQRTGIIGWNIRQTYFQRRAGLCTLCATTAAGKQAYHAVDLPEEMAVALADAAVPGLVGQFVEPVRSASSAAGSGRAS
ncbi:MAG TPA: PH domain-containing protein [Marmoricola sp.]|nr:PH domain-containing protein [Marmoricola sp.]